MEIGAAADFADAGYLCNVLTMGTHNAIHLDAAAHMIPGGRLLHEYDVTRFAGPGARAPRLGRHARPWPRRCRAAGHQSDSVLQTGHDHLRSVYADPHREPRSVRAKTRGAAERRGQPGSPSHAGDNAGRCRFEAQFQRQSPVIEAHPVRRLGSPEDIADAVVFLTSDHSSRISGIVLEVAGRSVLV